MEKFNTDQDVITWVSNPENRKHNNWQTAYDESLLILAYKSAMHKHTLKDVHAHQLKEFMGLSNMLKSMFGEQQIEEFVQSEYPKWLAKLKEDVTAGKIPLGDPRTIDWEKECYYCPVDLSLLDKIENCIAECNKHIFFINPSK